MAVKPWLGAIVAPSNFTKPEDSAPTDKLDIEWVYGFGGDSTRDNVRLSAAGEIVYHVAACGLVLDVGKHAQRHIVKHTDDITCLAVSPDGKYAATGQMGKGLDVIVWDTTSMELVARLKTSHQRAIVTVDFSADGKKYAWRQCGYLGC